MPTHLALPTDFQSGHEWPPTVRLLEPLPHVPAYAEGTSTSLLQGECGEDPTMGTCIVILEHAPRGGVVLVEVKPVPRDKADFRRGQGGARVR